MDKGGGGARNLDTSESVGFLASRSFLSPNHGAGLKRKHSMDSGDHFPTAIEFPVTLNYRRWDTVEEPPGEKRVDEMDFFSDEKKKKIREEPDLDLKVPSLSIKEEDLTIDVSNS